MKRVRERKVLGHSLIVTRKRTEHEGKRVEILKEFAVNIGLYEKYMYVYIAESCTVKNSIC